MKRSNGGTAWARRAPGVSGCLLLSLWAVTARAVVPSPKGAYAHVPAAGADITTTRLAEGVYQFTVARDSYVRLLNSVAVIDDDGVVVFDTCTRPSSARVILSRIRALTDKPVRVVINSHWHPDHWSGNEVFAEAFPGVEIIATAATRETMENTLGLWPGRFAAELQSQQDALRKETSSGRRDDGGALTSEERRADEEDAHDYAEFAAESAAVHRTLPTLTYVDHLELHRGGREYRLMSMTGDAAATTVLYLPREKILVTGDVVSYPIPYASSPGAHADVLRSLAAMHANVIVPGHGPAFHDNDYVEQEALLLERVVSGVREALKKGARTLDEVQDAVTVDGMRAQFADGDPELERRYRDRVKAIVKLAVREARGGADL